MEHVPSKAWKGIRVIRGRRLDITVEGFGEKMHEEKCINLSKKQIWLLIGGFVVVLLLVGLLSSSTEKEKGITKSHRKRRKRRNV